MMDWTDRRCRAFHRVLTRRARLYTEMVTADAVVFGPRERLIGFDADEHPVALQLGGAEPKQLAEAARIGAGFGYDEVNLNCGCPSDRVQSGRFGACLMREPKLVAECVAAMAAAVDVPVTVKCRIGVDEQEPRASLFAFAEAVKAAGAAALIVHARKAWLEGLSPKDNRSIPPLDHELVHALKRALLDWPIILNGGLADLDAARAHLSHVDGIMLGRAAYQNPELLIGVDPAFFNEPRPVADGFEAIEAFMPTIARGLARGERLHDYTRHLHGLFSGRPGARAYRRILASEAIRPGAGLGVLRDAVSRVERGWERATRTPVSRRAMGGGVGPRLPGHQDEPIAFDGVALEPLEKAHAEQALIQRAAARHQRGHVAYDDRPDRDLVEPNLRRHRRAIGGGDGNVETKSAGVHARPPRVSGGQHHRGSAGVEQEGHPRAVHPSGNREFAAEAPVDDHLPASPDLRFRRKKFARDASDDVGSLKAIGVDAGQRDQQRRPDRGSADNSRNVARPRRTQAAEDEPEQN
jgi:tRNA-dihydrouridine synthase A